MTEEELRRHYLFIASDRRSKRGERTAGKNRLTKGRKGIGKFAGLMAASVMNLETKARGRMCGFELGLIDLARVEDIEQLQIAFRGEACDPTIHGTTIRLTELQQGMAYPSPNKLRQLLLQEYGRIDDFIIRIDGKRLDVDDIAGSYTETEQDLPTVGKVRLRFSLSDSKTGLRQSGITLRVEGRAVGKPSFFGLEDRDDFPPKLLRKLYGEVEADGLRHHITAGWDAPVENSELLREVQEHVLPILLQAFGQQYRRDMQLAQARLQRTISERLAKLPEHKRHFADLAIKKVLDKYYGEPESKLEPLVHVLLEALECSDYRLLLEHLAEAKPIDVAEIADGLSTFGLAEMAFLVQRSAARQTFLDQLEQLGRDPATSEAVLHKALEHNLWVFGNEYSLFSSNITLRRQIEEFLGRKYAGENGADRPDLLLNESLGGEYLLIEFKRPNHPLRYKDYMQAIEYRHELTPHFGNKIRVLLVGGSRSADLPKENLEPDVATRLFSQIVSTARRQIEWLLKVDG